MAMTFNVEGRTHSHLAGYHRRPQLCVFTQPYDKPNARTIGVEDEVSTYDRTRDCNALIADADTLTYDEVRGTHEVYYNTDASIGHGVEIISQPCTLAYHMGNLKWGGIFKRVSKHGFASQDTGLCGLHLHMGREQLGATPDERNDVIRRMIVVVDLLWNDFLKFSRRGSSEVRWCRRPSEHAALKGVPYIRGYDVRRDGVPEGGYTHEWAVANVAVTTRHWNHDKRYCAINCENAATVELRLNNGTISRDVLIAAMQLYDNLAAWCIKHEWADVAGVTFADIVGHRHYNELDQYCVARGLLTGEASATRRTCVFQGPKGEDKVVRV